jgi:hypothetical protein
MQELKVTLSKLLKYTNENKLFQVSQNGSELNLVFVPNFPEAEAHSRGEPVRIIMKGKVKEDKVVFEKSMSTKAPLITKKTWKKRCTHIRRG